MRTPTRPITRLCALIATTLTVTLSSTPLPAEATTTPRVQASPSLRTTARATTPSANEPVLLLMDTSESMSETNGTGNTTRIDAAKAAVRAFIGDLPQNTPIGLDTFPSDGDCGGAAQQFAVSTANNQDMDRYVRGLNPGGNTPTGLALQQAAEHLRNAAGRKGVIVLVSDGESNCENVSSPPCEVAKKLVSQGYDLTVNTVGLQISQAGRTELQCIADATQGQYVDVKNPDDLKDQIEPIALPQLTMNVSYPTRIMINPGINDTVSINATVSNTGNAVATDVQATISYDAAFSPGSASPHRRLGNLAPGDKKTFSWTFRPDNSFANQIVKFRAIATSAGNPTDPINGQIEFVTPESLKAFPDWLRNAKNFIVLGDSYSSGEGTGTKSTPFDAGSDEPYNSCHRSTARTYAGQLSQTLNNSVKVFNLACSGAVTWDFWDSSNVTADPPKKLVQHIGGTIGGDAMKSQRQQLIDLFDSHRLQTGSTVIFLTFGGNDSHFADFIENCVGENLNPLHRKPIDYLPKSCGDRTFDGAKKGTTNYQSLLDAQVHLKSELPKIYREIERIAQKKTGKVIPILQPSYPRAFADGTSDATIPSCDIAIRKEIPNYDRLFYNDVAYVLATTVATATQTARNRDHLPVFNVDTTLNALSNEHSYCGNASWIRRAHATGLAAALVYHQGMSTTWQNMFHPNEDGYKAEATNIASWALAHPSLQVKGTPASIDLPADRQPIQLARLKTVSVGATGGSTSLSPAQAYAIRAGGFAPGTRVTIEYHSNPEPVASITADKSGTIDVPLRLRSDMPLGTHHLIVSGTTKNGTYIQYKETVHVQRPLPNWWLPSAMLALACLVGASICRFAYQRSRKHMYDGSSA